MADSVSIYMNNGQIYNVADMLSIPTDFIGYPNSGIQTASWSKPFAWINGQSYIQDSWEAHFSEGAGHTYGWFNNLKGRNTKATHQEYLNKVLANGAFIWGDAYNGGLYIYKSYYREAYTTGCLYGLALFCGYGVDSNDSDYDIFSIVDYPTASGLTWEQIETIAVIRWYSLSYIYGWETEEYYSFLLGGNIIEDGHCVTKQGFGQLESDPILPNLYTGISYTFSMATTPVSETLADNPEFVTINPLNPFYSSYDVPMKIWMDHRDGEGDGYYTPQSFGPPTTFELEGYDTQGDWAGGQGNVVQNDPNEGDVNVSGGGYGNPSKKSDKSGFTTEDQFGLDATDAGSVTIFNPNGTQMRAFNNWLYQSLLDDGLTSIWNNLKKMYANPQDYIISMGLIKYHPSRERSASEEIKFNGTRTHVTSREVRQWSTLDCGSVLVENQFESFLDYQGFSKTSIYLPFCGTFDLDQLDVMGSQLHLVYNIDNLTGSCVAVLEVKREDRGRKDDCAIDSKIYRFNGNCSQQLPIASKDFGESIKTLASIAVAGIAGAASFASGNFIGAAGSLLGGAVACTQTGADVLVTANLSQSYGMLDGLKPFVILHRPMRAVPAEYGSRVGYPSVQTVSIGNCHGYTKIMANTNFAKNIPCTDEEKQEIQNYLENGIIA